MSTGIVGVFQTQTGREELVLVHGSDGALQRVLYCPVLRPAQDPTLSRYRELTLGADRPQWNTRRYVIDLRWHGRDVELVRNGSRMRLDGTPFFFHNDNLNWSRVAIQPDN